MVACWYGLRLGTNHIQILLHSVTQRCDEAALHSGKEHSFQGQAAFGPNPDPATHWTVFFNLSVLPFFKSVY